MKDLQPLQTLCPRGPWRLCRCVHAQPLSECLTLNVGMSTHEPLCVNPWQKLFLAGNQVGDNGAKALASAVANGALPALQKLIMCKDAPALKAACEARMVEYI